MDSREKKPADRELEEALAYAATLKSTPQDSVPAAPDTTPDLFTRRQAPMNADGGSMIDEDAPRRPRTERLAKPARVVRAQKPATPTKPTTPTVPTKSAAPAFVPLATETAETVKAETPAVSEPKPGRFLRFLYNIIPVAGDPWWEIGRKLLFLVALVVLIGSLAMLLNEAVIIPNRNAAMGDELINILTDSRNGVLTPEEEAYDQYPEGISLSFKKLYYLNNDVRGWIDFPGCGISREVMYSSKENYYLYRDIYKNDNKNGSLFFDVGNNLSSASSHYKSLVIYGHNMASGQMFAPLNQLASSLDKMKQLNTVINLETLYTDTPDQYKIFAVVLQDPNSKIEHYYSIQATSFASNSEFTQYVAGLRARSLYDFNDVDVTASDDILILYTCAPKSVAGFDDARLGVIARKLRPGESASVSGNITKNSDVIQPYAWYTAQKKTPHDFYSTGTLPNTEVPDVTEPTDSTTPVTDPSATSDTPTTQDNYPGVITRPPTTGTTASPDGTTAPSTDGETTVPADGETTVPADGETTVPADGETTIPADGETTVPADGETTLPADGETTATDTTTTTEPSATTAAPEPTEPPVT